MAQVAREAELRGWIEDYLRYLDGAWQAVPALAAEWHEWDDHSRLVFRMDWPVIEDRLSQLRGWAEAGQLAPAERVRYERVLALERQHRPTLEQLLVG